MSIDTLANKEYSRRDFLGLAGRALGVASAYPILSTMDSLVGDANAQVTNLNVTPYNYKSILESIGTCIVMYNHRDASVKEGEEFIKLLDQKFSKRIPIYRIEMGSWPDSESFKWVNYENEKNAFPSYHIFINGKRDFRIRGPPPRYAFDDAIQKVDNYLKDKGI
jgi:hypothetical protein